MSRSKALEHCILVSKAAQQQVGCHHLCPRATMTITSSSDTMQSTDAPEGAPLICHSDAAAYIIVRYLADFEVLVREAMSIKRRGPAYNDALITARDITEVASIKYDGTPHPRTKVTSQRYAELIPSHGFI
jgi:hypothetical protein